MRAQRVRWQFLADVLVGLSFSKNIPMGLIITSAFVCAGRCVSVPLAVLWSSCPKISAMSGSLTNLRRLLTDNPEVKLSQDGSAVLVQEEGTVHIY